MRREIQAIKSNKAGDKTFAIYTPISQVQTQAPTPSPTPTSTTTPTPTPTPAPQTANQTSSFF